MLNRPMPKTIYLIGEAACLVLVSGLFVAAVLSDAWHSVQARSHDTPLSAQAARYLA